MLRFDETFYLFITGIGIGVERKLRGLTQEELAEAVCSVRTLRGIERGAALVKDRTYDRLCSKMGYGFGYPAEQMERLAAGFAEGYRELGMSRLFDWEVWKEKLSSCLSSKDLAVEKLTWLLFGTLDPGEEQTAMDPRLHPFLEAGFSFFPDPLQELCLNKLYQWNQAAGHYAQAAEIVQRMESLHSDFPPNVLCILAHKANQKDFFAVLKGLHAVEQSWLESGNDLSLLKGYEIALIPTFHTSPSQLQETLEKAESLMTAIQRRGWGVSPRRCSLHFYHLGLACLYAKEYLPAYRYLKKSCEEGADAPGRINLILLEYSRRRLLDQGVILEEEAPTFDLRQPPHPFQAEYHYFYLEQNRIFDAYQLQLYILDEVLPRNLNGTEILYQVFLYEMIRLSNETKAYLPLKKYVEAVNR